MMIMKNTLNESSLSTIEQTSILDFITTKDADNYNNSWMSTPEPALMSNSSDSKSENWLVIFDYVQLACTSIGCVANLLTFVTLAYNHRGFSCVILILLRHQSLVDAWVCLLASLVVIQPFMWTSGVYYLDQCICHAWHGQAFYWGAVTISTYNLMIISVERYLAVCKPLYYQAIMDVNRKRLTMYVICLYISSLIVTHGTYLQTRLVGSKCLNKYFMDGKAVEHYFFGFVIFTYIATYLLPALVMGALYSKVAYELRLRNKDTTLGHSNLISSASKQLTKTAVVVTLIFVITIGYDLHYYLLGYTGITTYTLNTPIQKAGVFLSNMNSCINPFIYAMLMPLYRQSIIRTFFRRCCHKYQSGNEGITHGNSLSSFTGSNITIVITGSNTNH